MGVEDWIYFDVPSPRDRDLLDGVRDDLTFLLACKLEANGRVSAAHHLATASAVERASLSVEGGMAQPAVATNGPHVLPLALLLLRIKSERMVLSRPTCPRWPPSLPCSLLQEVELPYGAEPFLDAVCRALNWADEEAERLTDDDYRGGGGYDDDDDEDDDMDDGQGSRGPPSQDYREVGGSGWALPVCVEDGGSHILHSADVTVEYTVQRAGRQVLLVSVVANDRLRKCRP